MIDDLKPSFLSEAEEILRERFSKKEPQLRLPSNAEAGRGSDRVGQLTLPVEERRRMPFTKAEYLVKENPHLVQWEREARLFLRHLSPLHGHRVSAVMIYEWATGFKLTEVMEVEKETGVRMGAKGTWRADLRNLNKVLSYYFGTPKQTWIMGRKVAKAYTVKPGYYIKRHRPMTLELYAEYCEGTLNP